MDKQKYDIVKNYFLLAVRLLLAVVSISYGNAKIFGQQFGLNPSELDTPIKDLSLFKVSWYLFGQEEPFKYVTGIFQIIGGLLLLFKKTELLGAILLLPIFVIILTIDVSFVKMPGFYLRIPYYIVLLLVLINQYRSLISDFVRAYFNFPSKKISFPYWAYFLLPVICIVIEFLPASIITVFQLLYKFLFDAG